MVHLVRVVFHGDVLPLNSGLRIQTARKWRQANQWSATIWNPTPPVVTSFEPPLRNETGQQYLAQQIHLLLELLTQPTPGCNHEGDPCPSDSGK